MATTFCCGQFLAVICCTDIFWIQQQQQQNGELSFSHYTRSYCTRPRASGL